MKTLTVMQYKGGVGKTTLAVNLAAGLAEAGQRVALLDLDPQGSASAYLNVSRPPGVPSVVDVLRGRADLSGACVPVRAVPRLSVVPSDLCLSGLERELNDPFILRDSIRRMRPGRTDVLEALSSAPGNDVVVIDTAPGWTILSVNALAAATETIAPVEPKHLSLVALVSLVGMIADVRREHHPGLRLSAIAPFRVQRTRLARECIDDLEATFPGQVLPAVRECARLAESPGFHLPISRYAPGSNGHRDMRALIRSVERRFLSPAADSRTEEPPPERASGLDHAAIE